MKDDLTAQEGMIRRFSTARIVEHWLAVIMFSTLLMTGLSQRFFSLDISQWFILKMGGIDNVRLVHRFTGMAFVLLTFSHIVVAVTGVIFKRWHPSMMITKNDFADALHNIKYYVGIENAPAKCDRYTYKQKFEYWGILTGGLVMIGTGFVLWFPTFFAAFLPGEVIPVAKALHTNEAMVIVLLIAVWHIYNSIFSPEVFPLDTSIFTGYISRERMEREHPIELLRMEGVVPKEAVERKRKNIQGLETEKISPE